jgi:hypothetical protein
MVAKPLSIGFDIQIEGVTCLRPDVIPLSDYGCIITGFTTACSHGGSDMFLLKPDSNLQGIFGYDIIN